MHSTIVIVLFAFVPSLSQNLVKSGHLQVTSSRSKFSIPFLHRLGLRAPGSQQPRLPPASAFAPAYAGSYSTKLADRSQQDSQTPGSQSRLPPARAFAPAYAGSYSSKLADRPQHDSWTLQDQHYDARAIAPKLKEELARKALETAFSPRVPAYSETDTSGEASGFAPAYAPAYAPVFSGSEKGSAKDVSAPVAAWMDAYRGALTGHGTAPQEVAAKPSTYSERSSDRESGFAPSYAAAYAPAFGSAPRGIADHQTSSLNAAAYAPQEVAERPGTDSSGASGGFAPTYAAAYAPSFGAAKRSANGASAYQAGSAPAPASAVPSYAEEPGTDSSGASGGFAPTFAAAYAPSFGAPKRSANGASAYQAGSAPAPASAVPSYAEQSGTDSSGASGGFAPTYAAAYAPSFGAAKRSANEASAYQAASAPAHAFEAPAYAPQHSGPSSGGASGFASLFASAYAPAFFGSGRTQREAAPLSRDILQSPTSAFSGSSAPAPSFTSWSPPAGAPSSNNEASKGSSGFAPIFGAAYAPAFGGRKMANLDATETSPNMATIAVMLMGLIIGFGGVIFVVKRFRCSASTFKEPLVSQW